MVGTVSPDLPTPPPSEVGLAPDAVAAKTSEAETSVKKQQGTTYPHRERKLGWTEAQEKQVKHNREHDETEKALAVRSEQNPQREKIAIELSGTIKRIFEQARQLKENGKLKKFTPPRSEEHSLVMEPTFIEPRFTEEDDRIKFEIYRNFTAMSDTTIITYRPKERRGSIEEVQLSYGPEPERHGLEVNFWDDEEPTAKGSDRHHIMIDDDLAKVAPKIAQQASEVFEAMGQ